MRGEFASGAFCVAGHPLFLVAEGYALCEIPGTSDQRFYAWKFGALEAEWYSGWYLDRGGVRRQANSWPKVLPTTKEDCLEFIQADIDDHRLTPFDEARERARLMPV